ncbi:pilus assembly protein TadC [Chromobacterium alkanivorans]|uniref:hypothetical protein n=1 Tax=Chromobacterium alkanivorans TaxID=1071719 RepID=UPI002169DF4F|nr:hypothetical protein [Chromobacterium alkanivorans]MCS3803681.1 pilus assembly protein TadC [Chromobacterium alkanivorans]MCS3818214.1 pilus assembly protein TadC [Chromobacterium alkanivorans]MCS3874587.1 pilus assembly protein TadC [Chromobacterium alkanivorans]
MLLNLFKKMQQQRRFAMKVLLLSTLVFALSSALWRGLDGCPGPLLAILCPLAMLLALICQFSALLALAKRP